MKRIMLAVLPIAAVAYARDIPTQSPKSPRIDCTMKTILSAVIPPRYLICCWLVGPPPSGLTCVPDDPVEWQNPGMHRTYTTTATKTPSVTPTPVGHTTPHWDETATRTVTRTPTSATAHWRLELRFFDRSGQTPKGEGTAGPFEGIMECNEAAATLSRGFLAVGQAVNARCVYE